MVAVTGGDTTAWLVRRAGRWPFRPTYWVSGLPSSTAWRLAILRCVSLGRPGLARLPAIGAGTTTRNSVSMRVVEAWTGAVLSRVVWMIKTLRKRRCGGGVATLDSHSHQRMI
jgi:hypothetical protein